MTPFRLSFEVPLTRRAVHRSIAAALLVATTLTPSWGAETPQGPPTGETEAGSSVVATWRDGRVTRDELDRWLAFGDPAAAEDPDRPSEADALDLVFRKSLARAAEARGLDPRERLRLEAARHAVLVPALRREIVASVSASDEEVEALRRDHPEAFHRPRKLRLRNLYLEIGADERAEDVRRRMQEIRRDIAAGADFAALAERESESQSAPRGGVLGYVDPDELPPPVAAAVRDLAPGEVSAPVEHGRGLSLFLCEEIREAIVPTPEEVRAKLRSQLERVRAREVWAGTREDLLEAAAPHIDPGSSSAVLELPGYRLDPEGAEALVALHRARGGAELDPADPAAMAPVLRAWALDVLTARRAEELGLDRRTEVAEALRWRRLEALAGMELARRLEAGRREPEEEELRRYFSEHRDRYRDLAAFDLGAIHFGPADDRTVLEEARSVAHRLAAGELSFQEAARRHSRHPSAAAGGGIGWQTRHQVALRGPVASRAIRALGPGEATGLLHLESGLWIFELRDTREERELGFEEVEPRVRADWLTAHLPELQVELRARHLEEISAEVSPAGFARPRVIRWATATEFESYGFHVYRGPTPDGPFERLTDEVIPGAGTSDVPRHYRYEDTAAEQGKTYYYYVESISTSGRTRRLTPVRASKGDSP